MSMQFPPSSPLREGDKEFDPFAAKGKNVRGRVRFDDEAKYPTPNPSSSLARSSSPHREEEQDQVDEDELLRLPQKISFNIDKPIMDNVIGSEVKVTKVPLDRPVTVVGRSSQTSDVALKTNDKSISRNHIKFIKSPRQLVIECLGHNGFGITIPKACSVKDLGDNRYKLKELVGPLSMADFKKINGQVANPSIKLGSNYTEFLVRHGETIVLPAIANLIIEVRNNLLLIDPSIEGNEETDDEVSQLHLVNHENNHQKDKPKDNNDIQNTQTEDNTSTPVRSDPMQPATPAKMGHKITSEESTPVKKFLKAPSVLSDKTNTAHTKPFEKAQSDEPVNKRRKSDKRTNNPQSHDSSSRSTAKSHGAPGSESRQGLKSKSATPEPEIVSLDGVENLQEIKNILVNHLAFSRLSSTPMSILKNISGNINDLTNGQLKTILEETKPIGIISRQGKDAAGKPLEEEYYYIPEKDDDVERPKLVSSIKGHGGIRSCRTVHKQYFWRKPAPPKKDKK